MSLLAAMLAVLGVFTTPATAAPPSDNSAAKIEKSVTNSLAAKDNADYWVMFGQAADLSAASKIKDWNARGAAVVDALRKTADAAQASVRAELDKQKVSYTSYYIVNAIRIKDGSSALAQSMAKHAEVSGVLSPREYSIPKPTPGQAQAQINAIEWGIAAINADDVWNTFGDRGEGITVASVDTGVDFMHPALVGKYRGNLGNGTFNHNYNFFDPAHLCATPAPCDTNGHGTHTMGTMVGDDGTGNQVGVAPNAKWIAAAGCCPTDQALLDSGQWILAPTDLAGANPRPDLRPNIVNNSWGSTVGSLPTDPFYKQVVQGWRASGIFPAFSNGNSGPACESSGSPGDYTESFSSGAFDINGNIASFSARGPGETGTGLIKPNLSAPGVDVRSSLPGGAYGVLSGTSMASPHLVGTVALMWSAAPSLIGDLAATEAILNSTAHDVSDLSCGGSAANNNVWGQGKLDAFAAVDQSPRGPTGVLTGTVTDAANGSPIAGASVHITGPSNRDLATGADGHFTSTLPVGSYTVTASSFGYGTGTATVTITEGATTTQDFALSRVTSGTVSGHVRNAAGQPVGNATVQILGTPIPATVTAADGSYSFANVPVGTYQAKASAGGCYDQQTQALNVTGDITLDFSIPNRHDTFGNTCVLEAGNYVEGDTPLALSGDDSSATVPLPFGFFFYGKTYGNAFVSTNGNLNFLGANTAFTNVAIPSTGAPNAAIYPLWDDLIVDGSSQMLTKTSGTAPNREFVVEWRNAAFFSASSRVDFEAVLSENGEISLRYRNLDPSAGVETGNSATVGIENETGTDALQYSFNSSTLSDAQSIRFKLPPNGLVSGRVTDFNDGQAVPGATVQAMQGSTAASSTTAAADGTYRLRLLAGTYSLEAGKQLYTTASTPLTVGDGTTSTKDFALHTPGATIQGGPLSFLAEAGQLRTATLNLNSTSDLDLTYSLTSSASWLWTVPGTLTVPHGSTQPLTVRVDPVGLVPGRVYNATIDLTTNAGRTPTLSVPVTLVVPGYRKGVDAGATGAFTDANADGWVADQADAPGGFGYIGPGFVETTTKAIANTSDDKLYQSQRSGMAGYRFENLPAGVYQVELDFAELRNLAPGKRVFDVSLNGTVVLPGYDVAASVGTLAADRRTFFVTVAQGGSIEVFFGSRQGKQPPIVNSLRVTHRPDR
ncbi:MAG: carboxypeptidase regulatory-like domain-containing protein [Labedaea sp.]